MNIIKANGLVKTFGTGNSESKALRGIDVEINEGELVVILGPSGSGKTTLLNLLSGLEKATSGQIKVKDEIISDYNESKLCKFRRKNIGFIFQAYYLLNNINVNDNVRLGDYLSEDEGSIDEIIELVGLKDHKDKFPGQLSGGQKQRVAIARAISKKPKILFCDEPTGALDEKTGKQILELLQNLNEKYGTTIVMVTHNLGIADMADRVIKMNSGEIKEIILNEDPVIASEVRWV
jgi:putative ABC transport system ATP-binding protein